MVIRLEGVALQQAGVRVQTETAEISQVLGSQHWV